MKFNLDVLKIDPVGETKSVADFVLEQAGKVYHRDGSNVGLSGGVDSAVMAALAVRALGKDRVVGLVLPEKESNPISREYAVAHAKNLGIEFREIDITSTVDSVVSYKCRDEFIRKIIPSYSPACKYNITLPTDLLERASLNLYVLQVMLPDGTVERKRLKIQEFLTITSFANIKIRSRMIHLYAEAERRHLLVAGTTNRTELILGDFCKYGDGGTDIEALAHLYKNQIYQLADYLEVTEDIINREPSPDTFSLPVTDQEFFFRIPFNRIDFLLYAWEHQVSVEETANVLELSDEAVKRAFKDFTSKNRATAHLREMAHTLDG
jgi:NAD+ synthase